MNYPDDMHMWNHMPGSPLYDGDDTDDEEDITMGYVILHNDGRFLGDDKRLISEYPDAAQFDTLARAMQQIAVIEDNSQLFVVEGYGHTREREHYPASHQEPTGTLCPQCKQRLRSEEPGDLREYGWCLVCIQRDEIRIGAIERAMGRD